MKRLLLKLIVIDHVENHAQNNNKEYESKPNFASRWDKLIKFRLVLLITRSRLIQQTWSIQTKAKRLSQSYRF